jgi:AcrR family transcriptional regulator
MDDVKLDSKIKIQVAAKKIFAQKGYEGTSIREIVREAQVNISLISYYYGGKEALFLSLFQDLLGKEIKLNITSKSSSFINEFKYILTQIIKLRFDDPELVDILQQEIIMKSVRVEKFKDFLIPIWNRIIELLEEGVNSGVFKYTSLSNALSFVMSVAVFPRQLPYFIDTVSEEHKNIEKTIEELVQFILKGLSYNG